MGKIFLLFTDTEGKGLETKKEKQMRPLTSKERAAGTVLHEPFIFGELKILPSVG